MASGIHRREIPYIPDINFCLFVCLECIVPLESFHSYGDVTIAGEGPQILTYMLGTHGL